MPLSLPGSRGEMEGEGEDVLVQVDGIWPEESASQVCAAEEEEDGDEDEEDGRDPFEDPEEDGDGDSEVSSGLSR